MVRCAASSAQVVRTAHPTAYFSLFVLLAQIVISNEQGFWRDALLRVRLTSHTATTKRGPCILKKQYRLSIRTRVTKGSQRVGRVALGIQRPFGA